MAEPWYRDGLAFECTQCGNCCTGAPGFVWVTPKEIEAIAEFLELTPAEVTAMYTFEEGGRRSLRELEGGDCVFFKRDRGCTIYEARPIQCRTWPFWESNIKTPESWKRMQKGCPGAGQGTLFTEEEITARMKQIRL